MDDDDDWYIKSPPRVANTKAVLCVVDDHLAKSEIMLTTWWSGEGFTLEIEGKDGVRKMDFSWQEWEAAKKCLDALGEGQ